MKKVSFYLTRTLYQYANDTIIREKSDVLGLLLNTIPEISMSNDIDNGFGTCEIIIDKMSRLIFTLIKDGKVYKQFSFNFPFFLQENENVDPLFQNKWNIFDIDGEQISNQTISILKILFTENAFINRITLDIEPLDFYEQITQAIKEVDENNFITDTYIWRLVRYLYLFETGYLRYDYDDHKKRRNKLTHPLHHLDFYYSSNVTLKIGISDTEHLHSSWKNNGFEKLIDNNKPCYYLKLN